MTTPEDHLKAANAALLQGNFEQAVAAYVNAIAEDPGLLGEAGFNLSIARRRWRSERRSKTPRVVIALHDGAAPERALQLASAHAARAEVVFASTTAGPALPREGLVWPVHVLPASGAAGKARTLVPFAGFPDGFPARVLNYVLETPCDILHLTSGGADAVLLGLLYRLAWRPRIILDAAPDMDPAVRDLFDGASLPAPAADMPGGQIGGGLVVPPDTDSARQAFDDLFRDIPAGQAGDDLLTGPQAQIFAGFGGWAMLRAAPHSRIVVYSVVTGAYESVKELAVKASGVRYLLFTDDPGLKSDTWEVVLLDDIGVSARRAARIPKLLPHRFLPDHEISIYLDGSLTLKTGDLEGVIAQGLQGKDLAAYPHFERDCLYEEIEECLRLGKTQADKIGPLTRRLGDEGFPRHLGLVETAFLIRRNTPEIRAFDEEWYGLLAEGEERDRFYLMYLLWKRQLAHAVIPNSGNFRTSPWLAFEAHAHLPPAQLSGRRLPLVIYSCLFGDYEEVKDPEAPAQEGVEYILFTDRSDLKSDRWRIQRVDESFGDLRRTSRLPKILAHRYLPPHEISIYLDSSLVWQCEDSLSLARSYLMQSDIALYRHYARDCIYEEIAHCIEKGIVEKIPGEALIESLHHEGFPEKFGLFENAFIIRRNTPEIARVNAMWWQRFISGPHRDQFYLMPSLIASGISPAEITHGEQFRKSTFMTHHKHAYRKNPGMMKVAWMMGAEAEKGWAYSNNARRFIDQMRFDSHKINQANPENDVAVFFDPLIHNASDQRGRVNVVRLGGPRPLARLFGGDVRARAEYLRSFDAVIALNQELAALGEMSDARTYMVPNGIDLDLWPVNYDPDLPEFTVGFAGNVHTAEERRLKGFDYLKDACTQLGIKLKTLRKGEKSQIAHGEMHDRFYGKISCLVHAVAEGKEGSSNVIMEALSCGVPVVTTLQAGFHSEKLTHGENVLFTRRNVEAIKTQITKLRDDGKLRRKLSRNGREFAERFHDIRRISAEYRNIFSSALAGRDRLRISFIPVQTPAENFATGRIRCLFMADALNRFYGHRVRADMGLQERADVIVVSQLCDSLTLTQIQRHVMAGAKVIYDLCDPYFSRNEEVYGVFASSRFKDLAALADLIVCPTQPLARMVEENGCETPVVTVPDMIDYQGQHQNAIVPPTGSVVWFGNPGHGNFESGLWVLKELESQWKYGVSVISVPEKIKAPKSFKVQKWAYTGFVSQLRNHGLALVSHDPGQGQKSNNRFLAAIANGIPVIATGSRSSAELLQVIGYPELYVSNSEELNRAMHLLNDEVWRETYVRRAQAYVEDEFGALSAARNFYTQGILRVIEPGETRAAHSA